MGEPLDDQEIADTLVEESHRRRAAVPVSALRALLRDIEGDGADDWNLLRNCIAALCDQAEGKP